MNIKQDKQYALACLTSMGVRITPADRQPVHTSNLFRMQATSAESNVMSIAASLGMPVKILTKFVNGSPISAYIQNDLRSRGMAVEAVEVPQGSAWGYRHQFNIADSGFGMRAPRVWNDRSGEVGRILSIGDFDMERIFGREGVAILHLSGLIAALSPETGDLCVHLVRTAQKYGTKVSFDLNYRASFWKNREIELRSIFHEIASNADILIGNEEDFQLALGIDGPETGGKDIADKIAGFQEMIEHVRVVYPNATTYATTLREVISANEHRWGAILWANGKWYIEMPREIQVLDRIGGGDGFAGGLLYAILRGWEEARWVQFGWATGALVTTMVQDYALPVDEEQVWSVYEGNARVKR